MRTVFVDIETDSAIIPPPKDWDFPDEIDEVFIPERLEREAMKWCRNHRLRVAMRFQDTGHLGQEPMMGFYLRKNVPNYERKLLMFTLKFVNANASV